MTALRLFNTVRYLKPEQIVGRLQARLRRVAPDGRPAPVVRASAMGAWDTPVRRSASVYDGFRVRFLNEDGEIAHPEQWNDPAKAKLWLYNLHYFDDLAAPNNPAKRDLQRALVNRWIEENPPGEGNGWEPYPVSLRIVNWIKWALAGETIEAAWRDSLAMQVRWLARHIEWHLLGNHLMANAKALVFAGLYFDGEEAERWLADGLTIYARELPEQILDDGAHFELSPMYHAIILEDLLDLLNVSRAYGLADGAVFADLADITTRMRRWLAAMTHPDGGPAFFNDCAFRIAASQADLEAYAQRLGFAAVPEPGEGVHHLATSGYVRVNVRDMAAIIDVAAVGPDYIPGHAHADTLSFELSLGGERIVVNGGTSTYAPGPQRTLERSTAAHSTVVVAGQDSSEVWSSFRVARRARVKDVSIHESPDEVVVKASHDGYCRLPGRPEHHRTWRLKAGAITIEDRVVGSVTPHAIAYFHLGPDVAAKASSDGRHGDLTTADGRHLRWIASAPAVVTSSHWSREFGCRIPTSTLSARLEAGHLTVTLEWSR